MHVSCKQTHEAIRRAWQKGMRVYGGPLIQFLTLDDSEYQNSDWDHAARRVMSPPFRGKESSGPGNSSPQPGRGRFVPHPPFAAPAKALSTWKALTSPRAVARDPMNIPAGV